MKKFTPILILIIIVGVVSVSGCISIIDSDNSSITDNILTNSDQNNTEQVNVEKVNKSGNIIIGTQSDSNKIKKELDDDKSNQSPKISKDEIEKEVVRIMKLDNSYLNFTASATLSYSDDGTPYYLVDVYDDYGWFGFFEINANNGPYGNDEEGYSFDGGAVRGETGDEPTPIEGVMPKIAPNTAREIMDKELNSNYSIDNALYAISGYLMDGKPYYNITIEEFDDDTIKTIPIGTAIMDANTGEIISISLEKKEMNDVDDTNNNDDEKVYSVDEAGAYVDIIYKGKEVSVRENYPYYSPQNEKIYHSQEEEAEDLIRMYEDFN